MWLLSYHAVEHILVDLLEHISIYNRQKYRALLQNGNFKAQLRLHSYY